MSGLFEDIFRELLSTPTPPPQPARVVQPVQKPQPKPAKPPKKQPVKEQPKPLAEGEGTDVCIIEHPKDDAYEIKVEEKDVLLRNVDRACGGNRYLEGMVLGEILNTPRFKSPYRR